MEICIHGTATPVSTALPVRTVTTVREGQESCTGNVLESIPQPCSKVRGITVNLTRVAEKFEPRLQKDAGMLAEITGTVSFEKEAICMQRLIIKHMGGVAYEAQISKEKHIIVHDGQVVNRVETIMDGTVDLHDKQRRQGIEAMAGDIVQRCKRFTVCKVSRY